MVLRTGVVVVRRTVRVASVPRSMVKTVSATWTVVAWPACSRPTAIFCPQTIDQATDSGQSSDDSESDKTCQKKQLPNERPQENVLRNIRSVAEEFIQQERRPP